MDTAELNCMKQVVKTRSSASTVFGAQLLLPQLARNLYPNGLVGKGWLVYRKHLLVAIDQIQLHDFLNHIHAFHVPTQIIVSFLLL